jgi:hypothetical protein
MSPPGSLSQGTIILVQLVSAPPNQRADGTIPSPLSVVSDLALDTSSSRLARKM